MNERLPGDDEEEDAGRLLFFGWMLAVLVLITALVLVWIATKG